MNLALKFYPAILQYMTCLCFDYFPRRVGTVKEKGALVSFILSVNFKYGRTSTRAEQSRRDRRVAVVVQKWELKT